MDGILKDILGRPGCLEAGCTFKKNGINYIYKVICDSSNYNAVFEFCQSREGISYAEPCVTFPVLSVPDDTVSSQWYLNRVNAPMGWSITATGTKTIAVVDDAVNIRHPDLQRNIYANSAEIRGNGIDDDGNGFIDDYLGYDVASGDTDVNPPLGTAGLYMYHGTHVSGIAAAVTDNQLGVAALSWNRATIIPVKASSLPVVLTNAEEGIAYAATLRPDILCLSFGGTDTANYTTLRILLKSISDSGTIIIAAAGNDGSETPVYPAAYPFVYAVGATDKNDKVSAYSSYGAYIDIMAPGDSIYSLMPEGFWAAYKSGTSMSAPLVAAAAAYIWGIQPSFSGEKVMQCILQSADPISGSVDPKYNGKTGSGRLNLYRAGLCAQNNAVSIPAASDRQVLIYPNPANEGFFLDFGNSPKAIRALIISDLRGSMVRNIKTSENYIYIATQDLSPGIYILKSIQTDKEATIKFSVIR